MPKKPVTFRCNEELIKNLDRDAAEEHRDRSNLIVKILTTYYENKNGKRPKKAGTR
jgi:metal-responsive CopG/Arc/MetJ family transcriptional regulator